MLPFDVTFQGRVPVETLPKEDLRLKQIHTQEVWRRGAWDIGEPEGDGHWTTAPFLPLTVKTADCVPLLLGLEDASGRACLVGAIHGGWRSGCRGIISSFVNQVRSYLTEGKLHIWTGPHIRRCCFQVGPEVIADAKAFLNQAGMSDLGDWWEHDTQPGKALVALTDLYRVHFQHLLKPFPIVVEYHDDWAVCTRCNLDQYHSYRAEGKKGSNISTIQMLH